MLVSLETAAHKYFIFSQLASNERIQLLFFDGVQLFCNLNIENLNDFSTLLGAESKPDSRTESWDTYAQKLLFALQAASSTDFKFDVILEQGFLSLSIWEKLNNSAYLKLLDRYKLPLVAANKQQLGLSVLLTNISLKMKSDKQEIERNKQKSARLECDNKLLQNELAKSIKESNNATNEILENVYILHSARGHRHLDLVTNIDSKKHETIESKVALNKYTDDYMDTLSNFRPTKRPISQLSEDIKPVIKQEYHGSYELLGKKIMDANEFTFLHTNTQQPEPLQAARKEDPLESITNSSASSLPSFLRKRIPQVKAPPSGDDTTNPLAYI